MKSSIHPDISVAISSITLDHTFCARQRTVEAIATLLFVCLTLFYVPKSEDSLLSEAGQAGSDSKHEGKDPEGGVDGHETGAETGGAFVADQQQEEAEEAECVLE